MPLSIITISLYRYAHSQNDIPLKNLLKYNYIKIFNSPSETITTFPVLHINNILNSSQLKEKNIIFLKNLLLIQNYIVNFLIYDTFSAQLILQIKFHSETQKPTLLTLI